MDGRKFLDGSKNISANHRATLVPLLARIAAPISRAHAGELLQRVPKNWTRLIQKIHEVDPLNGFGVGPR